MPDTRDHWKQYLSAMKHSTPQYPFGPEVVVYKIGGKMFALLSEDDTPPRLTLRADPDRSEEWRSVYSGTVTPGYHMNKRLWNTVVLDGTVPDDEVREMIEHSYSQIMASLPRAMQKMLTESAPLES